MTLSHYTAEPFTFDPARTYEQSAAAMKPRGLWLSVDGADDWPEWCRSEDHAVASLAYRTPMRLRPDRRVLLLSMPDELIWFGQRYGGEVSAEFLWIDWPRVADEHDGLFIAPYLWSMRLDSRALWYYAWDCASGCVWNLAAVDVV